MAAIATNVAVAVCIWGACVDPNAQSPGAQAPAPAPASDQPIILDDTGPAAAAGPAPAAAPAPPAPAPAPAAAAPAQTVAAVEPGKSGNAYTDRFLALWHDIHSPQNGYFSPEGVPYHAVETLLCEAPDYGHETTSEAYSYWLWLEAAYGKVTRDWGPLDRAWKNMERYIIPTQADQPTNMAYTDRKPATYAPEGDTPAAYPSQLTGSVPVGRDPLALELTASYGRGAPAAGIRLGDDPAAVLGRIQGGRQVRLPRPVREVGHPGAAMEVHRRARRRRARDPGDLLGEDLGRQGGR
jgi:hypothetical protein